MYRFLLLLPLCLLEVCASAIDHMVPVKRALPKLSGRSADYASDVRLRTQAELLYSHPWDDDQRVATSLTFHSHPGKEILPLEDIDHLTHSVSCNRSAIEITFIDLGSFEAAEKEWKGSFVLITSHEGCGNENQRTPYHIPSVNFDVDSMTATLETEALEWTSVGKSMEVHYGHSAATRYAGENMRLRKRLLDVRQDDSDSGDDDGPRHGSAKQGDLKNVTFGFDKDFGSRTQLFPPSVDFNNTASVTLPTNSPLKITCLDCLFVASLAVGGNFMVQFNASSFKDLGDELSDNFDDAKNDTGFFAKIGDGIKGVAESIAEIGDASIEALHLDKEIKVENAILEAKLDQFHARLGLEVLIEKSFSLNASFGISPKIPLTPFMIPAIIAIGPAAGITLETTAAFNGALNFSSGIEFEIPKEAKVSVNFLDLKSSEFSGWGATDIRHRALTLNAGGQSVTFTAAIKPYVELSISVGPPLVGTSIGAGLELSLPKLSLNVEPAFNVTSDCSPANSTDFETYDAITIDGTGEISLNVESNIELLGKRKSLLTGSLTPPPIFRFNKTLFDTVCLAVQDGGVLAKLTDIKPNIDFDGLATWVQGHDGKLPPGLNATNIVQDKSGYNSLPKEVQKSVTEKSEQEQAAANPNKSTKKSSAVRGTSPSIWIMTVLPMAVVGALMMLM